MCLNCDLRGKETLRDEQIEQFTSTRCQLRLRSRDSGSVKIVNFLLAKSRYFSSVNATFFTWVARQTNSTHRPLPRNDDGLRSELGLSLKTMSFRWMVVAHTVACDKIVFNWLESKEHAGSSILSLDRHSKLEQEGTLVATFRCH